MEKWMGAAVSGFLALMAAACPAVAESGPAATPPRGVYMWFPQPGIFPTEIQCREVLDQTNASREYVERWLRGEAPIAGEDEAFYLVLSPGRMETTFSAEGDYDSGAVSYGSEADGVFLFRLEPDGQPGFAVEGSLKVAKEGHAIAVALNAPPGEKGALGRTASYCRVPERETTAEGPERMERPWRKA